jgi:thiol-disulfide isomerase/thioredoxin
MQRILDGFKKAPARSLGILVLMSLGACPANAQPANDMFANRITITGTNFTVTGSNVGASSEPGEPYHAGEPGGVSVWWSWTATFSGTATISTAGSSFDTLLGVYVGSSVSALTEVASNDDALDSSGLTSKVVFDVTSGQTYQIAVDGFFGDSGDIYLQVQLAPPQPPPPAPAWVLPDPYGQIVSSTTVAGKVVILDFWATWCGPCVAEIPDLIALQDRYRADGLVIVGASVEGDPLAVQTFTETTPVNYQLVMADGATEAAYGGTPYIPTTFVIDRQNIIRKKYVGTQSRSTFEKQIIPLLYGNTRLTAHVIGTQLWLRWPTNALSFTLESCPALRNPTWTNWPASPTVANGMNTVQVSLPSTNCFFRLRMPY